MDCFWPRCSNHKRCEAHGSCVAKAQAGGASWPTTRPRDLVKVRTTVVVVSLVIVGNVLLMIYLCRDILFGIGFH